MCHAGPKRYSFEFDFAQMFFCTILVIPLVPWTSPELGARVHVPELGMFSLGPKFWQLSLCRKQHERTASNVGHDQLWPTMAGHAQPWPAMIGHGPVRLRPAMACHGWLWPPEARHGRPWRALVNVRSAPHGGFTSQATRAHVGPMTIQCGSNVVFPPNTGGHLVESRAGGLQVTRRLLLGVSG